MRSKPQPPLPARKQPTPVELRDSLLEFIERKFYQGHRIEFVKDRPRLLDWVVLWLARWLDERGVTIPADRYREIVTGVLMDALRFGNTENITYLPAWLAKVLQSHVAVHGDEIYDEGKNLRSVLERTLLVTGRQVGRVPDPVRELAQAAKLLKPKTRPQKPAVNAQLTLL